MHYSQRLHSAIPGGAHTYSRNQFPDNAPALFSKGEGAYLYTPEGDRYLDYGMGLRAVNCGYGEPSIAEAAHEAALRGNCLSRPSLIELEAAELMASLIDSFEMVKFTKTGSAATTAAVKLARAYTGRDKILASRHPFFSYDDWFIGSTSRYKGVSGENHVRRFHSVEELATLIDAYRPACVVTEPDGYDLKAVQKLCNDSGVVFILDEMITGFRYHLKGAQYTQGVTPDLSTFGKAMANGFSVACLGGKKEIMALGADDDVFLLSTTHGAEMCGLAAFVATVGFMRDNGVVWKMTNYGANFVMTMRACAEETGLKDFSIQGHSTNPAYSFVDPYYKTLFQQELVRHKVLMPWVAFSHAHGEEELEITRKAVLEAMKVVSMDKDKTRLEGGVIKPVFA